MSIINMGSTGPLQDLGMTEALATGLKLGETRRANMASEGIQREQNRINTENVKLRGGEYETEKSRLSSQLAKQTFDEAQVNRTNTMKAVENLSMYMNDKSPQEREMFKTTDHYKEVSNLVKAYAPEFYDKDRKEIVTLQNKDIYATQLEKVKSDIVMKIRNGGQPTAAEQQALDVLNNMDTKLLATALDTTAQNFMPDPKNPNAFNEELQRNIQSLVGGKQMLSNSYTNGLGSNPNDPLNIFGEK